MYCRNCGKPILEGKKFCGYCGKNAYEKKEKTLNYVNNTSAPNTKEYQKLYKEFGVKNPRRSKLRVILTIVISFHVMLILPFVLFSACDAVSTHKKYKIKYEAFIPESRIKSSDQKELFSLDKTYSYMSDDWHMYIATPISDKILQVDCWELDYSGDRSFKFDYEVGAFDITKNKTEFYWVDSEHAAFVMTFKDSRNSNWMPNKPHFFSVNADPKSKYRGTNCYENLACYRYTDEYYTYRAVALTEDLVKIECWENDGHSTDEKLVHNYDVCLVDVDDEYFDLCWNNEKTAFSLEMCDPDNFLWKEKKLVSFTLEGDDYDYVTVSEYIENNGGENVSAPERIIEAVTDQSDEIKNNSSDIIDDDSKIKSPSPTPTKTPTPTPTIPSLTPTNSPSPTPTNKPSPTPTNTSSPTPTNKPSPTPTSTPSPTPSPTPTPNPVVCEYAFVKHFSNSSYPNDKSLNYDIYFLFDTDNKKAYSFISTNPYTVDSGSYTGTIVAGGSWEITATIGGYKNYIVGTDYGMDLSDDGRGIRSGIRSRARRSSRRAR